MITRIKIVEKNNGEKVCIPQRRGFSKNDVSPMLFCALVPLFGWVLGIVMLAFWDDIYPYDDAEFDTEQKAKDCIDSFLKSIDDEYISRRASKTKKISYLRYP